MTRFLQAKDDKMMMWFYNYHDIFIKTLSAQLSASFSEKIITSMEISSSQVEIKVGAQLINKLSNYLSSKDALIVFDRLLILIERLENEDVLSTLAEAMASLSKKLDKESAINRSGRIVEKINSTEKQQVLKDNHLPVYLSALIHIGSHLESRLSIEFSTFLLHRLTKSPSTSSKKILIKALSSISQSICCESEATQLFTSILELIHTRNNYGLSETLLALASKVKKAERQNFASALIDHILKSKVLTIPEEYFFTIDTLFQNINRNNHNLIVSYMQRILKILQQNKLSSRKAILSDLFITITPKTEDQVITALLVEFWNEINPFDEIERINDLLNQNFSHTSMTGFESIHFEIRQGNVGSNTFIILVPKIETEILNSVIQQSVGEKIVLFMKEDWERPSISLSLENRNWLVKLIVSHLDSTWHKRYFSASISKLPKNDIYINMISSSAEYISEKVNREIQQSIIDQLVNQDDGDQYNRKYIELLENLRKYYKSNDDRSFKNRLLDRISKTDDPVVLALLARALTSFQLRPKTLIELLKWPTSTGRDRAQILSVTADRFGLPQNSSIEEVVSASTSRYTSKIFETAPIKDIISIEEQVD